MNSSTLLHGVEKVKIGEVKTLSPDTQYREFTFIGLDGSRHTVTAYFPQKQEKKS